MADPSKEVVRVTEKNYEAIYVSARSDEINTNNSEKEGASPYTCMDVKTGEKLVRPTSEMLKAKPICDLCFSEFPKFSTLYAHKGKMCYEDGVLEPPFPNPVQIFFKEEHLLYIADCIRANGLKVMDDEKDKGQKYVEVDKTMCEITLRRFYVAQVTKYNIEEWYANLEEKGKENGVKEGYTAHTIFMKLSDDELDTIRKWASIELSKSLGMPSRPTNQELELREKLEDKVNGILVDDVEQQKERLLTRKGKEGYFLKFSTRSPKDAVSIDKEDADLPLPEQIANKIRKLRVRTGIEAVGLLIKSQRIFSDINMFFQYRVKGSSSGELCLIFRDWVECPQDHEFRCYVHNRKLTAISQYHCYSYFEALQDREHIEKIRESIMKYVGEVSHCFPMPSFVIDVAVFSDYTCYVIEINPFGRTMSSGSALYNWDTDCDLLYGRGNTVSKPPIRVLRELIKEDEEGEKNKGEEKKGEE